MERPDIAASAPVEAGELPHAGGGIWADGLADYSWTMQDVSDKNELMDTGGKSMLLVVKLKFRERRLFQRVMWIQYTEAQVNGRVYVPPISAEHPHGWAWRGIDRYPNSGRTDKLPYSNL